MRVILNLLSINLLLMLSGAVAKAQVAYPCASIGGVCTPLSSATPLGIYYNNGWSNNYVDAIAYGNSIYNAANAYTDSKTATLSQQLALVSSSFDTAIRRQNSFLSQGIAMASAIEILPPNPGDRFAVNVGGAGYNGQGAGSVSVTVRLADNVLGYVGYGRSLNQNLVKGGLSISIH